jgi:hypothetical protein
MIYRWKGAGSVEDSEWGVVNVQEFDSPQLAWAYLNVVRA